MSFFQNSKFNRNPLLIASLSALTLTGTVFAGGNAKLMQEKHDRAFLLNKEVLSTLDNIEGNSRISFTGSVVRGPDGKLKIKIDSIDDVAPYSSSRSMSERTKIEYITFEEMLGSPPPKTVQSAKDQEKKNEPKSMMYGGGSVTD